MARYNYWRPLTPKQLNAQARRYANAQFGPVLAQINKEYARRSQAGASAIERGTSQLANMLNGQAQQTHDIYAGAQSQQAQIDNALAARLTAAGQSTQADVLGQLTQAGQRPSTTNLAQVGAGAGAASFGIGSAALSRLVAEGAARENYSSLLPGIARGGGAYRAQDLALQLESGRQKDVGELRSKIPGTVADIQQNLANLEFQKQAAAQSGLIDQAKLDQSLNVAGAKADQAAANAAETARHNRATENAKIVANDIAKYRATHPGAGKGGKPKTLSAGQYAKAKAFGIEAAKALKHGQQNPAYDKTSDNWHHGIPDKQRWVKQTPDGRPMTMTARQAYNNLRNHGMNPVLADWVVGRVYGPWRAPGEQRNRGPGGTGPR